MCSKKNFLTFYIVKEFINLSRNQEDPQVNKQKKIFN